MPVDFSSDYSDAGSSVAGYGAVRQPSSSQPTRNDERLESKLRHIREEWWRFNLNYSELNKHLLTVKKQFGIKKAMSTRSIAGETRTFAEILDQDVEKMVLFYLRTQGEMANRLWQLREHQMLKMKNSYRLTVENVDTMCQKYRDLGQDVLDLLEYLDSNVMALRRVIKKHDKQFDLQMGRLYFGARMGQNSQLVQLYHQEGLYAIIGQTCLSLTRGVLVSVFNLPPSFLPLSPTPSLSPSPLSLSHSCSLCCRFLYTFPHVRHRYDS